MRTYIFASAAVLLASGVAAQTCPPSLTQLTNGTTASATDVMNNFNALASCWNNPVFTGSVGIQNSSPTDALDDGAQAVFGPTSGERLSLNAGSIGFNRKVVTGLIYDTAMYAFQFQHFGSNIQASDVLELQIYAPNGSGITDNALVVNALGDVGIGTVDPSLGGRIQSSFTAISAGLTAIGAGYNSSTPSFALNPQSNSTWYMYDYGGGSWHIDIAGVNGSVGIATTNPSSTLYVNGSAGGTQGWNGTSDSRLKKNVRQITNALQLVERLQGVRYEWRSPSERQVGKTLDLPLGQPQLGFIAQDVNRVAPEAVTRPKTADGVYSMRKEDLIPILVEAVKAQQAEIEALKKEVAALKDARAQGQ